MTPRSREPDERHGAAFRAVHGRSVAWVSGCTWYFETTPSRPAGPGPRVPHPGSYLVVLRVDEEDHWYRYQVPSSGSISGTTGPARRRGSPSAPDRRRPPSTVLPLDGDGDGLYETSTATGQRFRRYRPVLPTDEWIAANEPRSNFDYSATAPSTPDVVCYSFTSEAGARENAGPAGHLRPGDSDEYAPPPGAVELAE